MPHVGEDHPTPPSASEPTSSQRRLTVHDAARLLAISEDAVRMRIKRGTLSADREGGRLYGLLTEEPTTEPTDRTSELINFHGEDHFTYEVCDNGKPEERCATAGVYVTIHPVNDSPIAREDYYATDEDMELTVSAEGGVLSNDEDVDDHRIAASVVWEPENGTLSLKEDGSFTYNPCTDFHGDDFFAYEVSDTKGSTATATTKITVRPDNDQPTALPATGLLPFHGTILIPNTDEQFLSVMPSGATSGS